VQYPLSLDTEGRSNSPQRRQDASRRIRQCAGRGNLVFDNEREFFG